MTCPLTIAISTRNRADFIERTLDSILAQLPANAELLILDGASNDRTPEVARAYQARHPSVRYVRLDTNGGVDRDYDRAVELSSGEYCWLMTDDDLLLEGAVDAVLAAISGKPSLVVVNAEVRNADLTKVVEERRLAFTSDRVYAGAELDRMFSEVAHYLSFIGCVVIRKSIWMSREREPYFGSLFVHMGVIFQQPFPHSVVVLARPLIAIRYGNAQWRGRQFEIWMFKWPGLVWSFPLISAEAKSAVIQREPWRKAAKLLLFRARGAYSRCEYTTWIRPRARSLAERLRLAGVLLVPGPVANALGLVYTSFKKDPGMLRIELQDSRYHYRRWLRRSDKA